MQPLLYDSDFYGWTAKQVMLLRAGDFAAADLENIIEEVEDMGKSILRALGSRLEVLLMHLLKWQYQPERRGKSWQKTIAEQRIRIGKLLRDNPSLKSKLSQLLEESYADALQYAAVETGLSEETFPTACPWAFEQVMDKEFWPESV